MQGSNPLICNTDMRVGEVRQFCKLDEAGEGLMRAAMGQMNLTARGYHRVLKLARTIADRGGCERIQAVYLAEALQYRPKLMMGWQKASTVYLPPITLEIPLTVCQHRIRRRYMLRGRLALNFSSYLLIITSVTPSFAKIITEQTSVPLR